MQSTKLQRMSRSEKWILTGELIISIGALTAYIGQLLRAIDTGRTIEQFIHAPREKIDHRFRSEFYDPDNGLNGYVKNPRY